MRRQVYRCRHDDVEIHPFHRDYGITRSIHEERRVVIPVSLPFVAPWFVDVEFMETPGTIPLQGKNEQVSVCPRISFFLKLHVPISLR